jgi:hypothetical protein
MRPMRRLTQPEPVRTHPPAQAHRDDSVPGSEHPESDPEDARDPLGLLSWPLTGPAGTSGGSHAGGQVRRPADAVCAHLLLASLCSWASVR